MNIMNIYRVQNFENGILIETFWIDARTGEKLPPEFTPSDEDIIVSGYDSSIPNWTNFNIFLMSDSAYNRIAEASRQLDVNRLENLALRHEMRPEIVFLWDKIISVLPEPPNPEEVAGWRKAAEENLMPFTFNDAGLMTEL